MGFLHVRDQTIFLFRSSHAARQTVPSSKNYLDLGVPPSAVGDGDASGVGVGVGSGVGAGVGDGVGVGVGAGVGDGTSSAVAVGVGVASAFPVLSTTVTLIESIEPIGVPSGIS